MQDAEALERITHELVEDVAGDGTRYVEIRWGPALHRQRGLSLRDGIAAVAAGARSGAPRSPRTGRSRSSCGSSRSRCAPIEPERNESVARAAADAMADGVAGFDLAGLEAAYPDPLLHARAYAIAREAGLGITVHAGEWGGAAQVWRALALAPTRIAHGAPAGDDPALMAELIAREITLDLCPTSNLQAGLCPTLADHPLPRIARAGVPATLCTDDRTVSALTLTQEYARARATLGLEAGRALAPRPACPRGRLPARRRADASAPAGRVRRASPPRSPPWPAGHDGHPCRRVHADVRRSARAAPG